MLNSPLIGRLTAAAACRRDRQYFAGWDKIDGVASAPAGEPVVVHGREVTITNPDNAVPPGGRLFLTRLVGWLDSPPNHGRF